MFLFLVQGRPKGVQLSEAKPDGSGLSEKMFCGNRISHQTETPNPGTHCGQICAVVKSPPFTWYVEGNSCLDKHCESVHAGTMLS